jgi:hypothetical protein
MSKQFNSLAEFYPFYLQQHRNGVCRLLHFIGTTAVGVLFWTAMLTQTWWLLLVLVPAGYGPAWIGHFVFEKNKPATFGHPAYSLVSDWIMWFDILRLRIPLLGILDDERIGQRA